MSCSVPDTQPLVSAGCGGSCAPLPAPCTCPTTLTALEARHHNPAATVANHTPLRPPETPPAVSALAPRSTTLFQLVEKVTQLTTTVTSLQQQLDDTQTSRSRPPPPRRHRDTHASRSRPPPPRRHHDARLRDSGRCWYHRRHGSRALKCTAPCTHQHLNENDGQ